MNTGKNSDFKKRADLKASQVKRQVFFSLEVLTATQSETQTLVFSHIAFLHARFGKFNSSTSAIAKHLRYSVNAVKNALSELLDSREGKTPLLIEEQSQGYNRCLKINLQHPLGYRLLQSYTQMLNKQPSPHTLPLYSVRLDLVDPKSRYDSRHQHKMLMLYGLINSKIKANKIATRNKQKSYRQSISQLSKKLGWVYMTVKSLLDTMLSMGLLTVEKDYSVHVMRVVFSTIAKLQSASQGRQSVLSNDIPIERYRDRPVVT